MDGPGRLVLAGGSGLLGRALASAWSAGGGEATILTRRDVLPGALPSGVRVVSWESRAVGGWGAELEGCRAVVNLSGENVGDGRWSAERKRRLRASRVEPSRTLVEAVRRSKSRPAAFVQASAIGYYAPASDRSPIDENAPPGTGFLAGLAREWEEASAGAEELGVRRVILRTGVVLAREGGALAKMLPAFRVGFGGRLGDGKQHFSWIHLADAVAAIVFLVGRDDLAGPFNLTAPAPVTNRELTATLGRVLRRPAVLPVPAAALRLLFGEMAGMILEGDAVVPRRLLDAGFRFRFPRLDGALADLVGASR